MDTNLKIRDAEERDADSLREIYAYHVLHGTGTFEEEPPSVAEMWRRCTDIRSKNLPFIVAYETSTDAVVGFAYVSFHHTRTAWRFTVEDSIYIRESHVRKGLGKLLMQELINQCENLGIRQMLARIGDSNNAGSVGLHQALGFVHVGTLKDVGWKFNRWLDVVVMQKSLGPGGSAPP